MVNINGEKLPEPKIQNNRPIADFYNRREKHLQPLNLQANQYAFIYDKRDFDLVEKILGNFKKAASGLGMAFSGSDDDIQWVEVPSEQTLMNDGLDRRDAKRESGRMIHCIRQMLLNAKDEKDPGLRIAFVLLQRPEEKAPIKMFLDKHGIVSQFMVQRNVERNLSKMGVFTNLLRQVNAKMPLDLYRICLPDKVRSLHTMFIGIDVCHKGHTSIVGLSASYTQDATQHFCKIKH